MTQQKKDRAVYFSAKQENGHLSPVVPHADNSLLYLYPDEQTAREKFAERVQAFLDAIRC